MKTPEEVRRELDAGPNVVVLKPKREPSYRDFAISAVELEALKFEPLKFVVQDILTIGCASSARSPMRSSTATS